MMTLLSRFPDSSFLGLLLYLMPDSDILERQVALSRAAERQRVTMSRSLSWQVAPRPAPSPNFHEFQGSSPWVFSVILITPVNRCRRWAWSTQALGYLPSAFSGVGWRGSWSAGRMVDAMNLHVDQPHKAGFSHAVFAGKRGSRSNLSALVQETIENADLRKALLDSKCHTIGASPHLALPG